MDDVGWIFLISLIVWLEIPNCWFLLDISIIGTFCWKRLINLAGKAIITFGWEMSLINLARNSISKFGWKCQAKWLRRASQGHECTDDDL